MLDAGKHRARAVRAELGLSSKGNEQVGIEFQLLDLPSEAIAYYGSFSENAFEWTMKALRAAGWKGDDLSDLSSIGGPTTPEVVLVVEHETYEGKVRAKVKFVNSTGGLSMKNALNGDQARAFAARMKGQVLAHNRTAGAPKAAPPPAERVPQDVLDRQGAARDSEDIPF